MSDMSPRRPQAVIVTNNISGNSLGRAYCLWLLFEHLEISAIVVAAGGSGVWGPLSQDARFSRSCFSFGESESPLSAIELDGVQHLLCIKNLPESTRLADVLSERLHLPVLQDVDDPDAESELCLGRPLRMAAKHVLHPRSSLDLRRSLRFARTHAFSVSNPELGKLYDAAVIPHVRSVRPPGAPHQTVEPTVAFIGTNRPSKGVPLLRQAAREVSMEFVITDNAAADRSDNERWCGPTTFDAGLALLDTCDIAAVPSLPTDFTRRQLPVKLIDAMMSGRAIIASDLPPIRWALGDAGLLVQPGNVEALAQGLEDLRDPSLRETLGTRARQRALLNFTVLSVAPKFASQLKRASGRHAG